MLCWAGRREHTRHPGIQAFGHFTQTFSFNPDSEVGHITVPFCSRGCRGVGKETGPKPPTKQRCLALM